MFAHAFKSFELFGDNFHNDRLLQLRRLIHGKQHAFHLLCVVADVAVIVAVVDVRMRVAVTAAAFDGIVSVIVAIMIMIMMIAVLLAHIMITATNELLNIMSDLLF